ncbi:MAG: hypothetical protein ACR2QC_00400 [Gammaproteobacteria bacterium]
MIRFSANSGRIFMIVAAVAAAAAFAVFLAVIAKDAAWRGCQNGTMPRAVCKIVSEVCRLKDLCAPFTGFGFAAK